MASKTRFETLTIVCRFGLLRVVGLGEGEGEDTIQRSTSSVRQLSQQQGKLLHLHLFPLSCKTSISVHTFFSHAPSFFSFTFITYIYIKKQDVVLAEAGVIEQYLANQFELLGNNEYEMNLIKSFHSSAASLHSLHATTVAFIPDREARKKAMEAFRDGPFTQWVAIHDKHLKDNGSNGHYIGNKVKTTSGERKEKRKKQEAELIAVR